MSTSDRPFGMRVGYALDWSLKSEPTVFDYPAIPSAVTCFDDKFGKLMEVPMPGELPARLSRLRDFEQDIVD